MASGTLNIFILKHKWHLEHRKDLFQSENGIWDIEHFVLKHKLHLEHGKCLYKKKKEENAIWNIENNYFKTKLSYGT